MHLETALFWLPRLLLYHDLRKGKEPYVMMKPCNWLVAGAGGHHAVAAQIGWATRRRQRGELADARAAAEAFQDYLQQARFYDTVQGALLLVTVLGFAGRPARRGRAFREHLQQANCMTLFRVSCS